MSKVEDFLTKEEEQEIVEAIRMAEKNTSGEIRVHIESKHKLEPVKRAQEVFIALNMNQTKERNGILFYLDIKKKYWNY